MADIHSSLVEIELVYDQPVQLSPLVRRITANNPSAFTGFGTNTYVIGNGDYTVVDPGPADDAHIDAILAATGGKISRILATHLHQDHSPAGKKLAEETGATLMGVKTTFDAETLDHTFVMDRFLADGETIEASDHTLQAVYTPGHLRDHTCYLLQQEAMLFAGDHIMQGATVVIVPPHGGSMSDYLNSLMKLKGQGIKHLAPAHGHLLSEADQVVQELYDHRMSREHKTLKALKEHKRGTIEQLAPFVYPEVEGDLIRGTHIALWAHLQKLVDDGVASKHREKHWILGEEIWEIVE